MQDFTFDFPSYTIGKDAEVAKILSYFPQKFINFLVKKGMILKMKLNK